MNINKKEKESVTRITYEEREAMYTKSRLAAMEKALLGEKVRFKSSNNPEKFKRFLKDRLELWETLKTDVTNMGVKDKGHYERLYDKTKEILENLDA